MVAEITAILTSLKTAKDLMNTFNSLKTEAEINIVKNELYTIIFELQSNTTTLQEKYNEIINSKSELEKKLRDMIDFNSEKNKYVLKEITTGIIAYVLKDENNRISDTHWLCQNCLDNQKKFSIYQIKKNQSGGSLFHCPSCKEEIFIPNPKPFQSPESGFDYHYD